MHIKITLGIARGNPTLKREAWGGVGGNNTAKGRLFLNICVMTTV